MHGDSQSTRAVCISHSSYRRSRSTMLRSKLHAGGVEKKANYHQFFFCRKRQPIAFSIFAELILRQSDLLMDNVELTDALFAKLAGWEAVKSARALLAAGRVLSSEWQPPRLTARVQEGSGAIERRPHHPKRVRRRKSLSLPRFPPARIDLRPRGCGRTSSPQTAKPLQSAEAKSANCPPSPTKSPAKSASPRRHRTKPVNRWNCF